MERMISRTVATYEYPISRIVTDENGTPSFIHLEVVTTTTPMNDKRLRKLAAESYPGAQLFFGEVKVEEHTYVMPLSEFVANATIKEDS